MHNFFLIIILLLNFSLPISSGNTCDQHNSPSSEEDCFAYDGNTLHDAQCCFYKPVDTSKDLQNICRSIPFSARINSLKYDVIENVLYEVKCNGEIYKNDSILNICAEEVNPKDASVKKCQKYSSFVDSCCYYDKDDQPNLAYLNPKPTHGCYWLGSKYKGKITWGGLKLKCGGHFNKLNIYMILLTLMINSFV